MAGRSAIIVPIKLPAALRSIRDESDAMAARGVPAHVTILFPFVPGPKLKPADRASLRAIAERSPAFIARFDRVEHRDDMVWLLPVDQAPFLDLTAAVFDAWPDCPPYEGEHERVIAHLTLVETEDRGRRHAAASAATALGPFEAGIAELWLLSESAAGTWRTRWRFPLAR